MIRSCAIQTKVENTAITIQNGAIYFIAQLFIATLIISIKLFKKLFSRFKAKVPNRLKFQSSKKFPTVTFN